jgi:hypothetical protein
MELPGLHERSEVQDKDGGGRSGSMVAGATRGGGHEGGEALEEASRGHRGGGGIPASRELAGEEGHECVRRGEGLGMVRWNEDCAVGGGRRS